MTSRSLTAPAASSLTLASLRPRRPPLGSRASSASSISSLKFLDLSKPSTPNHLNDTSSAAGYFAETPDAGRCSSPGSHTILDSTRVARSIPIAIELSQRKKSGPADTPPAPLSARGDLLGGYFPLHEENQRSQRPHPFLDYKFPSGNRSSTGSPSASETDSPRLSPVLPDSPQFSPMADGERPLGMTPMRPPTIDLSAIQMPPLNTTMGKYHPSNYKNKRDTPSSSPTTPQTQAPERPHHKRQKSDIRKKLQQYQRDMVEQAAVAANMSVPGPKPGSPRLVPLTSPAGLITPMALEEGTGYLGALGPQAERELTGRIGQTAGEGR